MERQRLLHLFFVFCSNYCKPFYLHAIDLIQQLNNICNTHLSSYLPLLSSVFGGIYYKLFYLHSKMVDLQILINLVLIIYYEQSRNLQLVQYFFNTFSQNLQLFIEVLEQIDLLTRILSTVFFKHFSLNQHFSQGVAMYSCIVLSPNAMFSRPLMGQHKCHDQLVM